MDLRIFIEPQQGASLRPAAGRGPARRGARLRRLLPLRPLPEDGRRSPACPGRPTPGSPSPASPATRERIRLGTLVTAATFRLPGPLAIAVAQVDAMSRRPGRARHRRRLVRRRARRLRHPVPAAGRAVRPARGAARDHHRPVVDARGRDVLLRRPPLPAGRLACACRSRVQRPGPPIIIGGGGPIRTPRLAARFAAEFNHLFPPARRRRSDAGPRSSRRARRSAAIRPRWCFSAAQVGLRRRRRGRGRPAGRRASAERRTSSAPAASPARSTQAREKLDALAGEGVTRVYLQVLDLDDLPHLETLAQLL